MSVQPNVLASYFLHARPDATDKEAIEYAVSQFPNSTIAVAQFMAEWRELRDPLKHAKYEQAAAK
jgi:hypothetical protein